MTAPLPDDALDYGPVERHERGFVREIVGALAVLIGLAVLVSVLLTVDVRWAIGLGAGVLIAGGLYLGRGSDSEVT